MPNTSFDSSLVWAACMSSNAKTESTTGWTKLRAQPRDDLAGEPLRCRDLVLQKTGAKCRADDGETLVEHDFQVEGRGGACEQTHEDQASPRRQCLEIARQRLTAEQVDHHVDSHALRSTADGRGKILVGCVNAVIQSQKLGLLELCRSPGCGQRGAPDRVSDLNRGRADAAARGVDQHPLTGSEPALGEQRIVGRDERFGHSRGLHKVEVARNRYHQSLMAENILSLPSTGDEAEDPVARLDCAHNIGPECIDLTGVLEPGDVGRRARRGRIHAAALHQISPVQTTGPYPDPHLIAPGVRCGHVADLEDLRAAGPGDDDGFHGMTRCSRSAGSHTSSSRRLTIGPHRQASIGLVKDGYAAQPQFRYSRSEMSRKNRVSGCNNRVINRRV